VELLFGWLLANGKCALVVHIMCTGCGQVGGITTAAACAFSSRRHGWGSAGAPDTGSALCARAMFIHWTASLTVIPAWDATAAAAMV
jgi:hypothetical protein